MRRLEAEADERWRFVKQQASRQWIARDAQTRQVMALHVGDRSRDRATALGATIPVVDREQATFHPDPYDAYTRVIPAERHQASTKQARKPNHIEHFNNTLRPRVSRLVRDTLSFSTTLANHIGAIKSFMCHDHLTRVVAAA
jgi:insertion element IS1 protein InsB